MKATDVFPGCISAGVNSSDREPWLKARRELVTASEVAAILGVDPYRDALAVYRDKVFPDSTGPLELDDPRFWGQVLERPVLETAANYYGWQFAMSGDLLISRQYPFIGATLDALVNRNDG
ncbi:MAG TPA: YqaJ viral recombinase family protein, partial [Solirubrobacterales bacterium]